ncbi:MAG TPA: tellurite resistance/C4-dicarboxylate transporter family protein [Geobacteraceae bacterium]|nr:tellurite resistance/C4-dicarboxylate transporter family protein [Geobacteraceae bacterium]
MISNVRARNAFAGVVGQCNPGYFAMVMATGIVSVTCRQQGMTAVSMFLFRLNEAVYAALWIITLARFFFRSLLGDELADYSHGPGYFTVVAGTCVLGAQFVLLAGDHGIASALWYISVIIWFLLFYGFFAAITARRVKSGLAEGIDGGWLLLVVSTQSISILGLLTASSLAVAQKTLFFVSLCFFLIGCMLYPLVITAVLYRLVSIRLSPGDLTPSYWICMGAAAISTLAGATLILESSHWRFLDNLVPVLTGTSLFFWAFAGLWIPLLIILFAWYHLRMRAPLAGASSYWSLVFPLGMYSACTFQLDAVTGLPFLSAISLMFNYMALFAWLVTFLAIVRSGTRFIRRYLAGD